MEHLLKYVDVRGKAYLRLVTDWESLEAVETIMDDFSRATWFQFSWIPIEVIPPSVPFAKPELLQLQRDQIRSKERDWVIEAHRRLASIRQRSGSASVEDPIVNAFMDAKAAPFRAWADAEYEKAREAIRQREARPLAPKPKQETIGEQIKRLREECHWTAEELASKMNLDERTVRRHEGDEVNPYPRTLRGYERVFSKQLDRKIVISKMP